MRWITGGPDLPPELLQALEDEQLVLFCGAGVSYPAGLPTFRGLVEKVYERLNQPMQGFERIGFENKNYDRVLGLLERRLVASPLVRRAVIETLHLDVGAALPTHKALLTLATTRNGVCRLVTTNFDRGFEFAARPGTRLTPSACASRECASSRLACAADISSCDLFIAICAVVSSGREMAPASSRCCNCYTISA